MAKVSIGEYEFKIHPLPILTAETDGGGGGDYRGQDPLGVMGTWARDSISMEDVSF